MDWVSPDPRVETIRDALREFAYHPVKQPIFSRYEAATAALNELVSERDALRQQVNSERSYRETMENLPKGTLPRV